MDPKESTGENTIFPQGVPGPAEWFTGTVWVATLMQPTDALRYAIGDVKFSPGARTRWHTHPIEQILLCTAGRGYYQQKGSAARALGRGDVVVIPPHAEHWHGAAAQSAFTHVAITNFKDGKNVEWLSAVTDEEYRNATDNQPFKR